MRGCLWGLQKFYAPGKKEKNLLVLKSSTDVYITGEKSVYILLLFTE